MKEITATDAARGFSALLDAVEHEGETFVVTRGGRGIARIESAVGASGATVKALLRRHEDDPAWREEVGGLREVPAQEHAWPD